MARQISAEDLSARLELTSLQLPSLNDEVGRLASTFNTMLERLDEAFKRERQFTADASHELRTPLAAIQSILGITLAKTRSVQEYQEALKDTAEEADRLQSLVEALLEMARQEFSGELINEPVDLSLVLQDVMETLQPMAEEKGLTVINHVPSNLMIQGNRDSLIRLYINLVDNAIKYTDCGEITVSGQRVAGVTGDTILTSVRDTGCGISAEQLSHIFDRFYRASESRTARGLGLGLTIAQQIAEAHHGKITVTSIPNQGTTFQVILPVNPMLTTVGAST
jgi:signal transduction histidine kinase